MKRDIIERALRKVPACCYSAVESCIMDDGYPSFQAIEDGVEHELQMYAEDQDGCITAKERNECVRFLKWLHKTYDRHTTA